MFLDTLYVISDFQYVLELIPAKGEEHQMTDAIGILEFDIDMFGLTGQLKVMQ